MARSVTLFLIALLLTPTACTGPTIQMDLYTWGYKGGEAYYLDWTQCDAKCCDEVQELVNTRIDAIIIDEAVFDYDSLVFQGDCWTNECPDFESVHYY